MGKGNKRRSVYFGSTTAAAIVRYQRRGNGAFEGSRPLFVADRGRMDGQALTRSGLQQMIEKLGKMAGIEEARCSPHTFRHTFAISFLRAGGTAFALQQILGHEHLDMTQKYVKMAQADIEFQGRSNSPVDKLRKRA
jgi:integrase/recombinase XerD